MTRIVQRLSFASAIRTLPMAAVFTILLCGCVSQRQHRKDMPECCLGFTNENPAACVEKTTNYTLGVVEIDDQGWLWDRQQMDCVLKWIKHEDAQDNHAGLLVCVFVHGWQHNAEFNDDYVRTFRKMLTTINIIEQTTAKSNGVSARKVAGVYVGWRGMTQNVPWVQNLTFWTRKRTAHEVGRGGLTELLLQLEKFVNQTKQREGNGRAASRLIVLGHSFGGAATYSALAPLLAERLISPAPATNGDEQSRGFGDLVVLANPAFEAARFGVLRDTATNVWGTSSNHLRPPANLVIFTSEADGATKRAFPLGRFFSTFFQSHRNSDQRRANRTAVGHYKPFVTHELLLRRTEKTLNPSVTAQPQDEVKTNALMAAESLMRLQKDQPKEKRRRAPKTEITFSQTRLVPVATTNREPFMVVRVSKKIIPDHNRIQKALFVNFLSEFLVYMSPENGTGIPQKLAEVSTRSNR